MSKETSRQSCRNLREKFLVRSLSLRVLSRWWVWGQHLWLFHRRFETRFSHWIARYWWFCWLTQRFASPRGIGWGTPDTRDLCCYRGNIRCRCTWSCDSSLCSQFIRFLSSSSPSLSELPRILMSFGPSASPTWQFLDRSLCHAAPQCPKAPLETLKQPLDPLQWPCEVPSWSWSFYDAFYFILIYYI